MTIPSSNLQYWTLPGRNGSSAARRARETDCSSRRRFGIGDQVVPGPSGRPSPSEEYSMPRHFQLARDKHVRVKTRVPIEGESFFIAPLVEADEDRLVLDVKGRRVEIPYRHVRQANIEFQF